MTAETTLHDLKTKKYSPSPQSLLRGAVVVIYADILRIHARSDD
jgi:hypothetical protein